MLPHAKKLRDYVDRGGFIFAEACCSDSGRFDAAFRQLMAAVFPEPEYKLQPHPARPSDLAHARHRPPDVALRRPPAGIEYGCRTCVVYCDRRSFVLLGTGPPRPMEHATQPMSPNTSPTRSPSASTSSPTPPTASPKAKNKPSTPRDGEVASATGSPRGVIEIAKLRHGGGCNDAPGALLNLLRTATQGELKLQVRAAPELINISDPNLFKYHLVFMHGRHEFHLTDAERSALREYLERGGTLLADSICASKSFTDAFRRELAAALPGKQLQAHPRQRPTLHHRLRRLRHPPRLPPRPASRPTTTNPSPPRVRQVEPQLEGIQIDGRWAVIFSPFDISCALESHEAIGCRGYTQQDAARIGLNVLLYSLNQ